jgi:SAM domain (Sterile alpha motif)
MQQVADWLKKLGLGQYAQRFAENDISFVILPDLTDHDLEKIGVASLGHRRRLLREIANLGKTATASPSTTSLTAPLIAARPVVPQPESASGILRLAQEKYSLCTQAPREWQPNGNAWARRLPRGIFVKRGRLGGDNINH